MTVTQPLRDEHRELLPEIESLRFVADAVGTAPVPEIRGHVEGACRFLSKHLIPHAAAEDTALYPVVARLMGAPEATATMRRDHSEVVTLTQELWSLLPRIAGERLDADVERALRRVLYGVSAIVRLHFAKEEEIYLPILDARLPAAEAREMFERMEEAAQKARAA